MGRLGRRAVLIALCCWCAAAQGRPLQEVLNHGTLRVGVALFAPWAARGRGNELIGFEVDVANQLAADMGVRPDIRVYPFDRLIPALEAGEIDLIAAGLTITPERALHVNFSAPYGGGGITLATHLPSTEEFSRLEELNDPGFKLAAVEGTVSVDVAGRYLARAELVLFPTVEEASAAVVAGDVHGYLEEQPVPAFLALEHPDIVDVPLQRPLVETRAGLAVGKGDPDFLAFLNAWITAREADTWLETRRSYWFQSLRWRDRVAN